MTALQAGEIDEAGVDLLQSLRGVGDGFNLRMIHKPRMFVEDIRSIVRSRSKEAPVGLVVIDHLKRIHMRRNVRNEFERYAEIMSELREITTESRCPVLLLAQMTRGSQSGEQAPPTRHGLYGGGVVDEMADIVALLWKPAEHAWWRRKRAEEKDETGDLAHMKRLRAASVAGCDPLSGTQPLVQVILDKHRRKKVPDQRFVFFDGETMTWDDPPTE